MTTTSHLQKKPDFYNSLEDCINSKKHRNSADVVWIPISSSPLKATYSITLLKHIFFENNKHTR